LGIFYLIYHNYVYLILNSFKEVQFTKDYAKEQIDAIRLNAEAVAIITSNSKVEEKFASTNLDYLIETTAKKQVNDKLGILVDKEIARFEEMITILPELTTANDQIRFGSKTHLIWLDSISNFHQSTQIREMAQSLLFQKGYDYTKKIRMPALNGEVVTIGDPYKICGGKPKNEEEKQAAINNLVNIILTGENLYAVGRAFVALDLVTGKEFKAFDITGVKNWYYSKK